ncbi:MAG TPA: carbonate dehydratase [Gammaproteobacteria bacterium]|jgi:carbonic anhydrase|nr:carbonate dehydratase [Gammaproteobacteria bacterium]HET7587630.1 carbonate dehydratase [Gammaproteobacteria bacterium]
MQKPDELLTNNRRWAEGIDQKDPDFFRRLSQSQSPRYLWIGCADSRVPASQVAGLGPGDMFIHRNISNVVVHTDLNCLSVIQYAVDVLKVGHIIVCGHYGCGGVLAALRDEKHGLIDNWLRHVQEVGLKYQAELDALDAEADRHRRLCELNVVEQVENVSRTTIVREAWARGQALSVHGWIYGLEDGLLRDLDVSVGMEKQS